jgi:hypothetical protein
MDPLLTEIVSVFAEHGIDGAEAEAAFRELKRQHRRDSGFDSTANQVSTAFEPLERSLKEQTHHNQVATALNLFYSFREEKDLQQICRQLTLLRFAPHWSDDQQEYYLKVSEKLEHWRDYFLSFTNYSPVEGEPMYVNNRHRVMISLGLGRPACLPETKERNLLALLLQYLLSNGGGLDGFYYPNAREPGDVQERLQGEAQSALVFVQLLQNSMFDKQPNYCLHEFEAARKDKSRTMIFIMTIPRKDFVKAEEIEFRMRHWHEAIMEQDPIELEPTLSETQAWDQLTLIEARLVRQVKEARQKLYDNVPI